MDDILEFSRSVDFGRVAELYRRHLAGYPKELLSRLAELGVGLPGQRLLDLGTGPGTLAKEFAAAAATVTAIDASAAMLEVARRSSAGDRCGAVDYMLCAAEETRLADDAFDHAVAGQAWHLFDRAAAGREALRVLRPGGALVITHYEWISLAGNAAEATEHVVRRFNPSFALGGHGAIYPQWLPDLMRAGFVDLRTFSFEETRRFSHELWRKRIQASAAGLASLDPATAGEMDSAIAQMLAERFPFEMLEMPHRSWTVIATKPNA